MKESKSESCELEGQSRKKEKKREKRKEKNREIWLELNWGKILSLSNPSAKQIFRKNAISNDCKPII